jgi:guanylate kinase
LSKGKVIVFTAPSGAGKTTIKKRILEDYPDFIFSISATTRSKRETETEAVDYFFISEKEFKQKIENDEFVEWEKFYDYYYGTLKSFISDKIEKGQTLVLDVDVKGALSIKRIFPGSLIIFIEPPSLGVLKTRLLKRKTESDNDLRKRIERVELELSYKDKFDCRVINDNIEETIKNVKEIINKFLLKED